MNKGIMVVKVGTAVLSKPSGRLDAAYMKSLAEQVCRLLRLGYKVILVSSGAIGAGMEALGISQRPKQLSKLQACAAVGQGKLMKLYEESFRKYGTHAAQILLTRDDLGIRKRCINARGTIMSLINEFNTIPVINENDSIATEEIKYTDNDELSHLVASLIGAHTLVILTDVNGVYSPEDNKIIPIFTHIKEDDIRKIVKSSKGKLGAGGMMSKVLAANIAKALGITCIIANGRTKDILLSIAKKEYTGTTFLPDDVTKTQTRKSWLAFAPRSKGAIIVDDGARTALVKRNKSLLAAGIKSISGKFESGDVVSISDSKLHEFAKGMASFSSSELNMIKGLKTDQIEQRLQRKVSHPEVVHRDNLVVLSSKTYK